MLLPVLIISSLVHLYSISYMGNDPHNQRFFSYLSLFTFMMIILVTADNYLLLFVGGVLVLSYQCPININRLIRFLIYNFNIIAINRNFQCFMLTTSATEILFLILAILNIALCPFSLEFSCLSGVFERKTLIFNLSIFTLSFKF